MDTKTAVSILHDEDRYIASEEDAENENWTHTELTIEEANEIADYIEHQAKQIKTLTKTKDTYFNDMTMYKKSCDDLVSLKEKLYSDLEKQAIEAELGRLFSEKADKQHVCKGEFDRWYCPANCFASDVCQLRSELLKVGD